MSQKFRYFLTFRMFSYCVLDFQTTDCDFFSSIVFFLMHQYGKFKTVSTHNSITIQQKCNYDNNKTSKCLGYSHGLPF